MTRSKVEAAASMLDTTEGVLEWADTLERDNGPNDTERETAAFLAECVRLRQCFEGINIAPAKGFPPKESKSEKDHETVRYWKRYGAHQVLGCLRDAIKGSSK